MIEEVQQRAAMRGMNPLAYIKWRNDIRKDYQQAFDPPPYKPATALPFGRMWMVVEPTEWPYEALVMVSELPDPRNYSDDGPVIPTWNDWAAMPESWRVR